MGNEIAFGITAKDVLLALGPVLLISLSAYVFRYVRRNIATALSLVAYFAGFSVLMQSRGNEPVTGTQLVLAIFGTVFMVAGFAFAMLSEYLKAKRDAYHEKQNKQ